MNTKACNKGWDRIPAGVFYGEDSVPPGTFHSSVYYRTKDGRADYGFSVERQANGAYRSYITNQPGYGGRAEDCHSTHRLTDGSRKYVCWTHELRSEAEAKQVAAMWADATQEYIRTGRRF